MNISTYAEYRSVNDNIRMAVEEIGIERVVNAIGIKKIVEAVGVKKIVEAIGLKKIIEVVGVEKVIIVVCQKLIDQLKKSNKPYESEIKQLNDIILELKS